MIIMIMFTEGFFVRLILWSELERIGKVILAYFKVLY